MKIKKSQLEEILVEEISNVLLEQDYRYLHEDDDLEEESPPEERTPADFERAAFGSLSDTGETPTRFLRVGQPHGRRREQDTLSVWDPEQSEEAPLPEDWEEQSRERIRRSETPRQPIDYITEPIQGAVGAVGDFLYPDEHTFTRLGRRALGDEEALQGLTPGRAAWDVGSGLIAPAASRLPPVRWATRALGDLASPVVSGVGDWVGSGFNRLRDWAGVVSPTTTGAVSRQARRQGAETAEEAAQLVANRSAIRDRLAGTHGAVETQAARGTGANFRPAQYDWPEGMTDDVVEDLIDQDIIAANIFDDEWAAAFGRGGPADYTTRMDPPPAARPRSQSLSDLDLGDIDVTQSTWGGLQFRPTRVGDIDVTDYASARAAGITGTRELGAILNLPTQFTRGGYNRMRLGRGNTVELFDSTGQLPGRVVSGVDAEPYINIQRAFLQGDVPSAYRIE